MLNFVHVEDQELSGTPRYFLKSIPGTNGRRTAVQIGDVLRRYPFSKAFEASEAQQYKWGAYCGTNWRCTASTSQTSRTGLGAPKHSPEEILEDS